MSRFTQQQAISSLNRALPPSSAQIHNPGILSETVQLVADMFSASWAVDQLRSVSVSSGVGVTSVSSGIVPKGKYWYVHSAHGVSLAGAVAKAYTLTISDSVTTIDTIVASSLQATLTLTGVAAYVGVTCHLLRPVIVPPLHQLNHNSSAVDAAAQLMLRWMFVELEVGTPPPIRF